MADLYTVTARPTAGPDLTVDNGSAELTIGHTSYQPTELLLAGLGSCMLATVIDYAQRNNIDADDVSVAVSGQMASRPRRIAHINATFHLPAGLSQAQAEALMRAGHRCTIHTTLENRPEITIDVQTPLQTVN